MQLQGGKSSNQGFPSGGSSGYPGSGFERQQSSGYSGASNGLSSGYGGSGRGEEHSSFSDFDGLKLPILDNSLQL